MKKATVTYTAPKGDSKVIEMLGTTLYDGQAKEVVCSEEAMSRLQGNQHFKVNGVADYDPASAPRPPKEPDKHK